MRDRRRLTQVFATLVTNPYWVGFARATIYRGRLKYLCHPGMQCYSCPSSVTACPLGALQNALGSARETVAAGRFSLGLYIIGFFGLVGMVFGRLVCGWVCPFGLLQDVLHKIPTPKLQLPRYAAYGKYVLLVALVILAPLAASFYDFSFVAADGHLRLLPAVTANATGATYPWYCKIVCPVGTLEAGIPKLLLDAGVRATLGFWFRLKWIILIVFLLWMVMTPRAFCRVACPVGAIYGLFNRYSLYRFSVKAEDCDACGRCAQACPLGLDPHRAPNHPDCIRCLDCVGACRKGALRSGFKH